MKIFVNASTVGYGGGLTVALNIIESFKRFQKIKFDIIIPKREYYIDIDSANITFHYISDFLLKKAFRYYTDNYWIKKRIKKLNPDVILSLGNLPTKTNRIQYYLHDNPLSAINSLKNPGNYSFCEKCIILLRNYILKKRLKYVDFFIFQTETQKREIQKKYKFFIHDDAEITIIPPSVPSSGNRIIPKNCISELSLNNIENFKLLLCLSRYYPHKNIEILLKLAKLFKQRNEPFKIILTISKRHNKKVKSILRDIDKMELNNNIINIEEIGQFEVSELFKKVDALLLPSLLESFSLTYIEAWNYNKPIFTSKLDFALETCADSAFFFNPYDPNDIYKVIINAFKNTCSIENKIIIGKRKLIELVKWDSIINYIIQSTKFRNIKFER